MEDKSFNVSLTKNQVFTVRVIPGHFTTSTLHSTHFIDVAELKANATVARNVARELAIPYISTTLVNTIVCMENTKVVGAYLAQELLTEGLSVMNSGGEIHVVTPMSNISGNLIFYDSEIKWVADQNVILLTTLVSSGRTLDRALECLSYYGGNIVGISALFRVSDEKQEHEVHSLYTSDDIPGYKLSDISNCEMCAAGQKLDAIISSEGYTKI